MPLPVKVPWECSRTGDCCHDVVMTKQEWAGIQARRPDAPLPTPHKDARFVEYVGTCPLLTEKKQCSVYDVRPMNCRRFGCFRPNVNVEPLTYDRGGVGVLSCVNARVRFYENKEVRKQALRMEKKAQKWGSKHGWTFDMKGNE